MIEEKPLVDNYDMMMQWWSDIIINDSVMMVLGWLWLTFFIIQLAIYLLQSWWLYMINKKFKEPNPWISWIPMINLYSFVKAAWKPWIWVLWLILGLIIFIIPWLIISIILWHNISKRTWRWIWTTIWLILIPFIMLPIVWYNLKTDDIQKDEEKKMKSNTNEVEKSDNKPVEPEKIEL